MMYKIIGADGKAYGPVSTEQIRLWINESRVNGQTQVQPEGTQEWKPLSSISEFADVFTGPNAPIAPSIPAVQTAANREAALQAVRGPAIGLKVTAILGLIAVVLSLAVNVLSLMGIQIPASNPEMEQYRFLNSMGGAIGIIQSLVGIVIGILILNAASKLQELIQYQFVMTAVILAMIPCVSPCCLIGLPVGIWALVVMNQPHVKSQFT